MDIYFRPNENEGKEDLSDAESGEENENLTEVGSVENEEEDAIEEEIVIEDEPVRRSPRNNIGIPPHKYMSNNFWYQADHGNITDEPKTFKGAISAIDADNWLQAMKEELYSIQDNNTWELTELPHGRKPIGSKWVFKRKMNENGETVRYKARLVAQGFSQKFGVDYDEVFAPVVRSTTLRLLLSVAGSRGYKVRQYDVKTAFLNGILNEEIYMRQPPGFQNGNKVYKLKKSLYGLKQAARVWNQTLHESLVKNQFQKNETDKCLYMYDCNEQRVFMLIHVDDILVASDNEILMQ